MTPAQAMLHAATGLSLSKSEVDRAIRQRVEVTGARDAAAYLKDIAPKELEALVELVVVPESWFYRDQQAFHAAADYLAARLASAPERLLRILTVPCAGGEEPYTMAMVLSDAGIPGDRFIIDAVDISQGCIERARTGIYGRNAFRNQDLAFRERHFSACAGDEFRINDDIRRQVRFKQGNVLEADLDARAGSYDVIFCRNLLIYFDKPTTRAAIAKLDQLLRRDGLLFVGYAEVPSLCQNGFAPLPYAQAFGLTREVAVERRKVARVAMPPQPLPAPPQARPTLRNAPAAASPPPRSPAPPPPPPPPSARAAGAPPGAVTAPTADLLADARRLADLGQVREAEGKCRDYLAQVPDSADAYFILGLLNELTKKLQLAEDYWKRCIYLQPDHYEALCHLALLAETNSDAATAAALKARAARIYKRQQAS
ncbi:chemotaxis protein methyltransferase WspC [Duganella sp. CF517]|uniref:CheR family methyltransferase n=1 Tax=Duganella sp. CF517 TaxID=1881038 RepID=UPI0008C66B55|nr:protein-glutamate O-methyltransferase CheR [Duganella sp. CF517]SEO58723.1 chemotaxis protein methyltransferase WspC [Duganella sp. CF517]